MLREEMTWNFLDFPWRMKNPIYSTAAWIPLLLASLSQGVLSLHPGYTLTAGPFVTVQHGHDVHIPCHFTCNKEHQTDSSKFYGYWFKNKKEPCRYDSKPSQSQPGLLVATNNERQTVEESTKNRIELRGDPEQGNCSFQINDAQLQDEGLYYFRVEAGGILQYSFYHRTLEVSVTDPPRLGSTQPNSSCVHEDNALFCTCSFQSHEPAQIEWQVEGETLRGNSTRGALRVTSWVQTDEVISSLNFSGSLGGDQPIVCRGSNAFGTSAVHFRLSAPTKGVQVQILVSAVGGSLVTAGIFLLGFCLFRLRKKKEDFPNMKDDKAVGDNNPIYCNITPMRG